MNAKIVMVSLIAILTIVMLGAITSAAPLQISNQYVEIDGIPATGNTAVTAGETVPVKVWFTANENASEVQVSAWVQGYRDEKAQVNFDDLISGSDYKSSLSVGIPADLQPEELLTLYVRIETDAGNWEDEYILRGQREPNKLDVLLVDMDSTVKAGETMPIGIVVKNMGRHESEDTMMTVKIPELGIVKTAYLDDLAVVDNCDENCDEADSVERKLLLTIPATAQAGVYKVEINAFNDLTDTTVTKTITIAEPEVEVSILANPSTKTFGVGEEVAYELILVNSGDKMVIYNLGATLSDALEITLSDYVAAVPAGSSKTVKVYVKADKEGTYAFAVNANSESTLSQKVNYTAIVKDKPMTNNNIIVLTIALAIIFVLLVIVLVVLLTRKPQKTEEFGESYY
jgi:hypothetical protein